VTVVSRVVRLLCTPSRFVLVLKVELAYVPKESTSDPSAVTVESRVATLSCTVLTDVIVAKVVLAYVANAFTLSVKESTRGSPPLTRAKVELAYEAKLSTLP